MKKKIILSLLSLLLICGIALLVKNFDWKILESKKKEVLIFSDASYVSISIINNINFNLDVGDKNK